MARTTPTVNTGGPSALVLIQNAPGGGGFNRNSVTVQNPSSNSDSVEIAWDDMDVPLVAGTGQILAPGDWRTILGLPVNAAGKMGVQGIALSGTPTLRVMTSSLPA